MVRVSVLIVLWRPDALTQSSSLSVVGCAPSRSSHTAEWVPIRSNNAPRVDHDASAAELFAYMSANANSRQSHPLMREWTEETDPSRPRTAQASPGLRSPAKATPAPTPAPAAVAPDKRPIDASNAVGRRVLVPAEVYPKERCSEQQGRGWECVVITASSATAKVRFTTARTTDGRPYENERLPLALLLPM